MADTVKHKAVTQADDVTASTTDSAKESSRTATFSQLLSNASWEDILYMTGGTVGALVTGASMPFFNILFGEMLDELNGNPDQFDSAINRIAYSFIVVSVINIFTGFLQVWCWSCAGESQAQMFRERYVNSILGQEIGWFDTCGAGELSTKVASLSGQVQDGLGRKVGELFQYASQIVSSFVIGFYLSWELTVILIASFPIIGAAGAFMINAVTEATNKSHEQYAGAGGLASESLGAIRTVTAFNMQTDIITKYRGFLIDAMNVGILKGTKIGLGNGLVFGCAFLTYALGFWYGARLVADYLEDGCTNTSSSDNCLTGGTILAVFFSVLIGSMALGQLAPPVTAVFAAKAAVGGIMEIVDRKPLIDGFSKEGMQPSEKVKGEIELKNIEFAYPSRPDIQVCRNYNLTISQGQSVALVGASGCGKSTIINLLLRFYDPQSGGIFLDGNNIKDLNIRWLRSNIGYVGQEPVLFSGTVAENILYGLDPSLPANQDILADPEKSMKRIMEAAQQANAHEFISQFPQGYQTDVGSNGVAMSGGQKQRIAIARALIKKPSVLLLDEATSALDATSEKIVQQSIDALQQTKSQTTIVIAHRLSTIRNADKICLIERGAIAEMGTHEELIAKNGLYADLVRLQMADHPEDDPSEATVFDSKKHFESADRVAVPSGADEETKADDSITRRELATKKVEVELSKDEQKAITSKVWARLMAHYRWLGVGILGSAVFGGVFPVWGLLLAYTQDMFYLEDPGELRDRSVTVAYLYIALAVIAFLSATTQFLGVAQAMERTSCALRSDMFQAIIRREISFFDDETNSIGALTTRLADDSRTVTKAFGQNLANQIQAIFTLIIGLALALSASWQIALVVLGCFPFTILASGIQMQAVAGQLGDNDDGSPKEGSNTNAKDGAVQAPVVSHGSIISSAFTHMRTVSAFSMQHKVSEHYTKITREMSVNRAKRSIVGGVGFGLSNGVLFLTYALLFWFGSVLIKRGDVNFRELMTAILTLMLGALGLGQALADMGDQKKGLQIAGKIFKSIEEGEEAAIDGLSRSGKVYTVDTPDAGKYGKALGRIELKDVFFRYPTRPDVEVCKGYTLSIEPGEMVALVGPSGSGKSTIVNLLLRFYDPIEGQILLDGCDIRDLNVRWLRSQMGYVGQEPVLFSGSVAENIAKGRADTESKPLLTLPEVLEQQRQQNTSSSPSCETVCGCCLHEDRKAVPTEEQNDIEMATKPQDEKVDDDIIEATTASNAHDFISKFPQGYSTDVGEGSIMVSGGQKQRIAIARALIKKPSVLLLDEATSALDATSERIVQQSIDALQQTKSQTTIVIAHRLSTIRNADKIIVVDKGSVVETGTHDQLLEKNGLYATLWAKQNGSDPRSLDRTKTVSGHVNTASK